MRTYGRCNIYRASRCCGLAMAPSKPLSAKEDPKAQASMAPASDHSAQEGEPRAVLKQAALPMKRTSRQPCFAATVGADEGSQRDCGMRSPLPRLLHHQLEDQAVKIERPSSDFAGKLASFSPSELSSRYKDAVLPKAWKSFSTVILGEVGDQQASEKIAAFDFDGCLVRTSVHRHGADAWSLMYPSIPKKLLAYYEEGFKLVIFTNESNIEHWKNSRQKAIDSKLGRLNGFIQLVKLPMQVFIACGKSGTGDLFRKPEPGMWTLMERHFNGGIVIDKKRSFYVGDAAGRPKDHSAADLGFAKAIDLEFLLPEDFFGAAT